MAKLNWKSQESIDSEIKLNKIKIQEQDYLKEVIPTLLKTVRKMVRVDEITVEELLDMMLIYPSWELGLEVVKGDYYRYNNKLYKVNISHLTQENWNPERATTMFFEVLPQDVVGEWKPYEGVVIYQIGSKVIYNGVVYESIAKDNVWKPDEHGWKKV